MEVSASSSLTEDGTLKWLDPAVFSTHSSSFEEPDELELDEEDWRFFLFFPFLDFFFFDLKQ